MQKRRFGFGGSIRYRTAVCKIMDYGKYRYKQSKKLHDAKKEPKRLFKLRKLN